MLMPAPRIHAALACFALALALTYGVSQTGRAFLHFKQGLDFTPEYAAALMAREGHVAQIYDLTALRESALRHGLHGPLGPADQVVDYVYAPWLLALYTPFTRMPWEIARKIWFLISVAACYGAAALFGAAFAPTPSVRRAWALGAVAATALYFPAVYGFMAGQANDLPLLGLAICLWLLRRDRPFLAGLVLAPVAMWKLFTGLPLLFLLGRREWRALAGLALGCALLVTLSLPFVGLETWAHWLEKLRDAKLNASPKFRNYSIGANVALLFSLNPTSPPWLDRPALVRPLTTLLQSLAALAALVALVPVTRREDPKYGLQFATILVLGVLLTPVSWEHYGVFLLPAFLGGFALATSAGPRPNWIALAILGASFAVWGLMLQDRDDFVALATASRVWLMPVKVYAALALLGVCAWLSAARPRRPAPEMPARP